MSRSRVTRIAMVLSVLALILASTLAGQMPPVPPLPAPRIPGTIPPEPKSTPPTFPKGDKKAKQPANKPAATPSVKPASQHGTEPVGHQITADHETEITTLSGYYATLGPHGQIRQFRDPRRGIAVELGLRPGDRRIVTERIGRTLVSTGPGRGYMQRPYYRDRYGHTYVQRTYWVHGHPYAYAYGDHFYHGVHYYWYTPRYYYHPVFYGWVYNPWPVPVYYNWGSGAAAPWFYGGYFAPAPVYPTASLWLTDYLLAENLKLAYENQQAAQANPESQQPGEAPQPKDSGATATPMSPQVKEMIDVEVHRQLQAEQAAAQSPQARPINGQAPPPALDPAQRLLVVSSSLGVSTAEGQGCELTPGDVITRIQDIPGDDNKVKVITMSSRPDDCGIGSFPRVKVSDLQEMNDSFREHLDAGLQALAQKSGTGGLPKAPDTRILAGEIPPPTPDPHVNTQLADQEKEATQAEAEVRQEIQAGQFKDVQPRPRMMYDAPPWRPGKYRGSPCNGGLDPRCRRPGRQTLAHTTSDGGPQAAPDKVGTGGSHKAQSARSSTGEALSPAP